MRFLLSEPAQALTALRWLAALSSDSVALASNGGGARTRARTRTGARTARARVAPTGCVIQQTSGLLETPLFRAAYERYGQL